jgi:demethylmenaquinone methyltransferase/2-methoxy-6-polyprenyl-1,4-benzoquinol methylase
MQVIAMSTKNKSVRNMDSQQQINIVRGIFSAVSRQYDFLNHFFSLRRDVAWRRRAVREMSFGRTNRFLDVATGTADLAIECAQKHPQVSVTGIDFVPQMLEIGYKKVVSAELIERVELLPGDATALEFKPDSFDVAAAAFGIRNIPDRQLALREMIRVTVAGGQIMILELTVPEAGIIRSFYNFYLQKIMPLTAALFMRKRSAYEYLADSIINFPTRREFLAIMEKEGLLNCRAISMTLGICTLYIGEVPNPR